MSTRRDFLKSSAAVVGVLGSGAGLVACAPNAGRFRSGQIIGRISLVGDQTMRRSDALTAVLDLVPNMTEAERREIRGKVALAVCPSYDAKDPLAAGFAQAFTEMEFIDISDSGVATYSGPDSDVNTHPTTEEMFIEVGTTWYLFVLHVDEELPVGNGLSAEEIKQTFEAEGVAAQNIVMLNGDGHVTESTALATRVLRNPGRLTQAA